MTGEDPRRSDGSELVCVFGVTDTQTIMDATAVTAAPVVVDLADLTAAELSTYTAAKHAHIVLGVAGWGGLRQAIPLTRQLSAPRITIVIRRIGSWSPAPPWEQVRIAGRRGARLRVGGPALTTVHSTVSRYLGYGPLGAHVAPARGLRVGLYGRIGEAWVAGDVNALHVVATDLAAELARDVTPLGDVVISARADVEDVRAVPGTPPVVSIDASWQPGRGVTGPTWSALATAPRANVRWPEVPRVVPGSRVVEVSPLAPVDVGSVNPVDFLQSGIDGFAATHSGDRSATLLLIGPAGKVLVEVGQGGALGPEQVAALRLLRGVRDRASAHRGPLEHARALSQLAAAGIPVVVQGLPEAVKLLLGPALSSVITSTDETMLLDDFSREAYSVALRRIALREHAAPARWAEIAKALPFRGLPGRTISVLLATRRPRQLARALHQIEMQRDVAAEVVLALHGDDFDLGEVRRLVDHCSVPVEIVRASRQEIFGDVLNKATERCRGDLLAKMDDDDWYGPYHLWDLVAALEYSGATMVGRPPEFVHLARINVTVRRIAQGCEKLADQVPGAAMMLRRADLIDVGGWRPTYRAVDRFLCRQIRESGGTIYQTHGFGFLIGRRDDGHTWESKTVRFLRGAASQWRGLRVDMATADTFHDPTIEPTESHRSEHQSSIALAHPSVSVERAFDAQRE